jgi:hypothetical protein
MSATIECRAQLGDVDCLHGRPEDPETPMCEDGTYDIRTGSVVCDSCYLAIMPFTRSGQALTDEIDEAISTYKSSLAFLRAHENPEELRSSAVRNQELAGPGSPLYESAGACLRMLDRELARRADEAARADA